MMYSNYTYYWGMNLIWCIVWIILIVWIFMTHYKIPGQRSHKVAPLDMLKIRLAKGEINKEEYLEKKAIIES